MKTCSVAFLGTPRTKVFAFMKASFLVILEIQEQKYLGGRVAKVQRVAVLEKCDDHLCKKSRSAWYFLRSGSSAKRSPKIFKLQATE